MRSLEDTYSLYRNKKELGKIQETVNRITSFDKRIAKLTDSELQNKTEEFRARRRQGETLEDILPEAYAVVREAAWRVLGLKPYPVQLIGGIVLHQGRIAELKTGEGKTLMALLPAYLNALDGNGVHVVTVNEYLADRDASEMSKVHNFLGLTVGCILTNMDRTQKQEAYRCDITYGTNNEFGFDYLRDNMVTNAKDRVQRGLNFAIIDEVDSVLIDEARTPLIISGDGGTSASDYELADAFVKHLKEGEVVGDTSRMARFLQEETEETGDYIKDEKEKTIALTQQGISKAEKFFGVSNLGNAENTTLMFHINCALRANYLMQRDVDYIIQDGSEVVIVDSFTGRVMPGRRFNEGLHQAIEAKEHVQVKRETKTVATITFQHFFNKYRKKSGMTGTAKTEEKEFQDVYGLDVISVPTNRPVIRIDHDDKVFKTKKEKYKAAIEEVKKTHEKGQPVLIGTTSVEDSELLDGLLKKEGIRHVVLNAKQNDKEAAIVAQAGQKGAVTIATNMAGRGTDIKLGEGVAELGGLKVIGTERHESRRIDNQLRGRSGRQGDPGESIFYISLEDDLMRIFGGDRLKEQMEDLKLPENTVITDKKLTGSIETAQRRVEGNNFDSRKHLLEYDEVINRQRELIYQQRNQIIDGADVHRNMLNFIRDITEDLVAEMTSASQFSGDWNLKQFNTQLREVFPLKENIGLKKEEIDTIKPTEFTKKVVKKLKALYLEKCAYLGERASSLERSILIGTIDNLWMENMDTLDQLKKSIGTQAYAQKKPVDEYKLEGLKLFEQMEKDIKKTALRRYFSLRLFEDVKNEAEQKNLRTNAPDAGIIRPVTKTSRMMRLKLASGKVAEITVGLVPKNKSSIKIYDGHNLYFVTAEGDGAEEFMNTFHGKFQKSAMTMVDIVRQNGKVV